MKKTILITGATSGIGFECAKRLANGGHTLILCGRRKERLEQLKSMLQTHADIFTLTFDVSNRAVVFSSINSLPDEFKQIDILINNAGNAHGLASIQDGSLDDFDLMIQSNVTGLLNVTKAILPLMIKKGHGHIINVGSLAGKEVYANGNVYCATKHAVDALTKGMRMDLNPHNIKVSAIHPGLVETEFSLVRFKGDKEKAKKVYDGYEPLKASDVAETINYMISAPAHVNIADVLILPSAQASATIVNKKN